MFSMHSTTAVCSVKELILLNRRVRRRHLLLWRRGFFFPILDARIMEEAPDEENFISIHSINGIGVAVLFLLLWTGL
jgi:hypothetical protein